MIDYRKLLRKYIEHICRAEGIDYLAPRRFEEQYFTREEWDELVKVSEEDGVTECSD